MRFHRQLFAGAALFATVLGAQAAVPMGYRDFQRTARSVLEAIDQSSDGPKPGETANAPGDRLEALANELLLAALYLRSAPTEDDATLRQELVARGRQRLLGAVDPASARYLGAAVSFSPQGRQLGTLCVALKIARDDFWTPLLLENRQRVAALLATMRGNGLTDPDVRLPRAHVLAFLQSEGFGERRDSEVIDHEFAAIESMQRGHGWFVDALDRRCDYQATAEFHFFAQWWIHLYGARDAVRAARWRAWTEAFADDFQFFFAPNGEMPAWGGGLAKRFAALAVFAPLDAAGSTISCGVRQRLTRRGVDFFVGKTRSLAAGWTDEFAGLNDYAAVAAAGLEAARGFAALALPPDDPFWTANEASLPSESGDYVRVIAPAGVVVRNVGGTIELVSAGNSPTFAARPYGLERWTKFSYRTGAGFTLGQRWPAEDWTATRWSADRMLVQRTDGGSVLGRFDAFAFEADETHVATIYNLGSRDRQLNTRVESYLWWRGNWALELHRVNARQPVTLTLGGFALPSVAAAFDRRERGGIIEAWARAERSRGSVLQPLHGFESAGWECRLDDAFPRAHVLAPYHAIPLVRTARFTGERWLAALVWTGADGAEAAAWTLREGAAGCWRLHHPTLGEWRISHPALPPLPTIEKLSIEVTP